MTKTINDVYMQLFKRFKEAGSPQPSLEARELTAYACKVDKGRTAEWGHIYLDDATVDFANLLCDRCLDGEPLAYILNEWDFYGLTFKIDKNVLIPRSDTERLAELAIERAQKAVNPRVLDLCCGSGCIGIAVAHEVEDARVTAVDISDNAVRLSRENARANGVFSRYVALKADVRFRPQNNLGKFDVIVSNPPYVTAEEMRGLDRSVREFEPEQALYGGPDGLDFYRSICGKWGDLLVPGGLILFECGYRQATQVCAILEDNRFSGIGITEDLAGVPRIVYGENPAQEEI
ncbi:peptide chain release factor N(5)-glutamine methyltransferase [Agathobaculum sp.]|uniref:peptide chain release factor N(5)-glutamine methyltransferase n=1 Tax=Agathobaculum sp. TaxID=2048138 RepID=UPI002A8072F9|nr:peptide chain release factor N(5)-glutamine methyltransferase [Agathobaculum sp.]MDY3618003.1 peptide chain release factor N(5)-glutamine methyltransferase [Agathobaculum sp.]